MRNKTHDRKKVAAKTDGGHNPIDGVKFGFFFSAPATHHLYYMLPLIRATKHRSVMVFDATRFYLDLLRDTFRDVKFISCLTNDRHKTLQLFHQYNVLIFANSYQWFGDDIHPELSPDIVLTRVLHGTSHKFADDRKFFVNSIYGWDAAIIHGNKDLDMFYDLLEKEPEKRLYAPAINVSGKKGKMISLIQSGNLRAQTFFDAKPSKAKLLKEYPFLDPDKKTVLMMPTHPSNSSKTKKTYSSLNFIIRLLNDIKHPENYNFLFKLHPNLVFNLDMKTALMDVCKQRAIPVPYEIFTADYFPLMYLADVMVTDRSSSVFDFLLFDKPIIFLDHTNECPDTIDWQDRQNSFWSFQLGSVVSETRSNEFENTLLAVLKNDSYKEIRQKTAKYSFPTDITPQDVLRALITHPKLIGS